MAAPLLVTARALMQRAGGDATTVAAPIPLSLLRLWRQAIVLDSRKATDVLRLGWTPWEHGVARSVDAWDRQGCGVPGQGYAAGGRQ